MPRETREDVAAGGRRNKGHHIARTNDDIEISCHPSGRQIKVGEVAHEPGRARMIVLGSVDEDRVHINADDLMTGVVEVAAHPARAAAGVENTTTAAQHRIDQPRLSHDVLAAGCHRAKPLDITCGVRWIGLDDLLPLAGRAFAHSGS